MSLTRALVTIPMDTAIPADAATNTWYFEGSPQLGEDQSDMTDKIIADLAQFYADIDQSIFPVQVGAAATVKCYDMADSEPRSPIAEGSLPLTGSTGNALPSEVAVALSFTAQIVSGDVRARKRGRIFLGPLSVNVLDNTGGGVCRPSFSNFGTVADAALALKNRGTDLAQWVIYSPTTHKGRPATPAGSPAVPPGTLGDATANVDKIWLDNAFDVIRSRGIAPTARLNRG
jgi:hypothetical protein